MPLFSDSGEEYYRKYKCILKNKLKVEVSIRKEKENSIILDVCVVLYHIHWPKNVKIRIFIDSFIEYR